MRQGLEWGVTFSHGLLCPRWASLGITGPSAVSLGFAGRPPRERIAGASRPPPLWRLLAGASLSLPALSWAVCGPVGFGALRGRRWAIVEPSLGLAGAWLRPQALGPALPSTMGLVTGLWAPPFGAETPRPDLHDLLRQLHNVELPAESCKERRATHGFAGIGGVHAPERMESRELSWLDWPSLLCWPHGLRGLR